MGPHLQYLLHRNFQFDCFFFEDEECHNHFLQNVSSGLLSRTGLLRVWIECSDEIFKTEFVVLFHPLQIGLVLHPENGLQYQTCQF